MKLVGNLGQRLDFVLFISNLSVSQMQSVIWCRVLDDRILQCSTSGGSSFTRTYSLKIRCNNISYLFLFFVVRHT